MEDYPHVHKPPQTEAEWLEILANLARFLRSPEGCPWDRKQSSRSFAEFLQEEAQELIEAFESGDDEHIEEELGDTLFCLFASAAAAEEEGRFTLEGAVKRIHDKMIRRHEHVFGDVTAETADEVLASWNEIKAREKEEKRSK